MTVRTAPLKRDEAIKLIKTDIIRLANLYESIDYIQASCFLQEMSNALLLQKDQPLYIQLFEEKF